MQNSSRERERGRALILRNGPRFLFVFLQRERQTDRHTDRHTETDRQTETERQREAQTDRQKDRKRESGGE